MPVAINTYPVRALMLDPLNPRLPETLQGHNSSEILRYLYDTATLEELAQSFLDNGFFAHEPLIVLRTAEADGRHVVLEGNRRLAALIILHGFPEAEGITFPGIEATRGQIESLEEIPCYAIVSRDEVHRYLGFRHIGGIKSWEPEAKARYLLSEVDRAAPAVLDPFKEVGRRVGSNAQGVRNPYIAIKVLQHARDEFGIDVNYVQRERFGVWLRGMNSKEIRIYIAFGEARTYREVQESLRRLDEERLREVLLDLIPREGRRKALLADSRDVTDYGRILANERARAVLRKHEDIGIAKQVIDQLGLPQRIRKLMDSCRLILEEVQLTDEINEELENAASDLEKVARSLNATVRGRLAGG